MDKENLEKEVTKKFETVFRNYESELNNIKTSSQKDLYADMIEKNKILSKYLMSNEFKEMNQSLLDFSEENPNTGSIIGDKLRELLAEAAYKIYK